MCDQCLSAGDVPCDHRSNGMSAAEAPEHREAAGLLFSIEHDGGFSLREQFGDQRATGHAARARVESNQSIEIALSGRTQPPAGIEPNRRRGQRDALVLSQFADARKAQTFVEAATFCGGIAAARCVGPDRQAAHSSNGAQRVGPDRPARRLPARASRAVHPSASAKRCPPPDHHARRSGLHRGETPAPSRWRDAASAVRSIAHVLLQDLPQSSDARLTPSVAGASLAPMI